jgi:EAL domain-containing protein (putative c-di-GMP-specific phosphodiesterase class I)
LVLYSQPIVSVTGGDPSEELLPRRIGRGCELIPPGGLLPAAEPYGILDIDQWIVTQAIGLAATGRRVEANRPPIDRQTPSCSR